MLQFFRKIRQKLLITGKTTKYVNYALGEIILVVIGILIALQINNWNEIRKERNKAFAFLSEFKKDIVSDTAQYNYVISEHEKNIKSEIILLKKIKISFDDIKNIANVFGASYYSRKINNKTFQKIQNTGNSNLLGFEDLYDQLSNYYTETSRDLLYQCEWEVKNYEKKILMLDDFMDKNNHEYTLLGDDLKQEFQIDSFPIISKKEQKFFILDFVNSVKGRNYIRAALRRHYYMRRHYKKYRDEAVILLNEIDKAIKSND